MFYGTSEFKEIHETSEMLRLLKRNPKLKFKKLDDPNNPETIYELGDQGYLVATDNPTVAIHYHIDDKWELLYPLRGPVTWQEALDYLYDCLAKGWRVIPVGDCDSFDYQTGCKGHAEQYNPGQPGKGGTMAQIDRFINLKDIDIEGEELKKRIDEAPEFCPITGLVKIKSYAFDEGVVYGTQRPLDAFTLPIYDPESQSFSRTRIDMDDDFRRDEEWLCDLADLKERDDYPKIKEFYDIT